MSNTAKNVAKIAEYKVSATQSLGVAKSNLLLMHKYH